MDPFSKAQRWRSRADELRALADELTERDAKMSLLGIAQALEHHATNLETAALNFGVGRRVVVREAAD
jgi:hypothetical protein